MCIVGLITVQQLGDGSALQNPDTSSCTFTRCRVVEQDLVEILHESWAAICPEEDAQALAIDHDGLAAQVIDAADAQDANALEAAFKVVQAKYDDQTLGEITDRILIYTVQKGWAGACKVCSAHRQIRAALKRMRSVRLLKHHSYAHVDTYMRQQCIAASAQVYCFVAACNHIARTCQL